MKKGPLDGVRVVKITLFQLGPVAGMRLGDLGGRGDQGGAIVAPFCFFLTFGFRSVL